MTDSSPIDAVGKFPGSTVSVLTPAGVGAIACVEIRGPQAWDAVCQHFRPAGKQPLPELPVPHRFWFGTLGRGDGPGDEVILSAKESSWEIHSHGGRRVVRWIVELFLAHGFKEVPGLPGGRSPVLELLTRATTERTASILLDQHHGSFRRAVESILVDVETNSETLRRLADLAPLGRHLVDPWRVVIAGPPNVGKSSLLNALAGYTRSVVAATPRTPRDVVTVRPAIDGWPIEMTDTAGLRDAPTSLEQQGIERARAALAGADLRLWLLDGSAAKVLPEDGADWCLLLNKTDLPAAWDWREVPDALP